jgi:hypothetical protein
MKRPRATAARAQGQRIAELLTNASRTLEELYERGVPPGELLEPLRQGLFYAPRLQRTAAMVRDGKRRRRQAAIVEEAANIIDQLRPVLERYTPWIHLHFNGEERDREIFRPLAVASSVTVLVGEFSAR